MTMTDPIADMLTRIRNANVAFHDDVLMPTSKVTCCHLPRGSVKRKSTYFTSLSLISFITSLAVVMERIPFVGWPLGGRVIASRAGPAVQMASNPDSPVLIRMASSMLETKIFPSPIRPV